MMRALLLAVIVLAPAQGHLRLEYLIVVFLLLLTVLQSGLEPILRVRRELSILLFLIVSGLLSIAAHVAVGGSFHPRDLMSVVRYLAYGAILAAAVSATDRTKMSRSTGKAVCWIALAVALLSFFQFYDVLGVNELIRVIYPESGVDGFRAQAGTRAAARITGTSGNPNWWGFMISAFAIMLTSKILIGKKVLWLPVLLALATAVLLTGSRTALVASFAGVGVLVLIGSRIGEIRASRMAATAFVTIFVILWGVFYQLNYSADTDRFTLSRMTSFLVRVDVWAETLSEYQNDLILGRGPAKSDRRLGLQDASSFHVRDNIYVSYIAQFGIVGLLGFLALCFYQSARLLRLLQRAPPDERWWPTGMVGVMVSWLMFGVAGDSFFFVPASNFFMALYGITLAAAAENGVEAAAAGPADPPPLQDWASLETGLGRR